MLKLLYDLIFNYFYLHYDNFLFKLHELGTNSGLQVTKLILLVIFLCFAILFVDDHDV